MADVRLWLWRNAGHHPDARPGLPRWAKWAILIAYITAALGVYGARDVAMIHQITWIPIVEYLGVLILAGIFAAGLWVAGWIRGTSETIAA